MKVEKSVDTNGYIEIKITDAPTLPEETTVRSSCSKTTNIPDYSLQMAVTSFTWGNYVYDIPSSTHYSKQDSTVEIAEKLESRFTGFFKDLEEYKKSNTETAEILTPEQVTKKLQTEHRLLYRNRSGQIKTLDI